MTNNNSKIIILAAGEGTRLQPLTSENGDDIFYIDILNIIEEVCNELFILRIFL